MNENILVIPGSFSLASSPSFGGYETTDIWLKKNKEIPFEGKDWIIGHSLGASYILLNNILPNQKIILVNPPVPKRYFLNMMFRDIKFLLFERVSPKDIIPISNWMYGIKLILKLLKIDIIQELRKLPKNNVFIIRGVRDSYFCDNGSVDLIKKEGYTLFEVDSGHLANSAVNEKIAEIIDSNN